MTSANAMSARANLRSIFMFVLLLFTSLSPVLMNNNFELKSNLEIDEPVFTGNSEPWDPIEQPWGQYSLQLIMELCHFMAQMEVLV